MIRVAGVLLAVGLYVYFIIDVLRTPRGQSRTLPRGVWLLVVILVPLLGGLAWLAFGRTWGPPGARWGRKRGPVAPDDDPRFLKQLDDDAWAERMRRRRAGDDPAS